MQVNGNAGLGTSGTVTINNGGTLQTSGSFAISGHSIVVGSGTGTIDTGANTNSIGGAVSGPGTMAKAGDGMLTLDGSVALGGLNANGGTVALAKSGTFGALAIGTSATVSLATHSGSTYNVLDTSSLAFAGITFAGVGGLGSFDEATGDPVDFNQVPLKVAYLGDLNGDDMVDGSDYGLLDYGFQTQQFGVLTSNGAAVASLAATVPASSAPATSPEAVPEPGSIGLLLAGALGLLGFRRNGRNRW